MATRSKVRKRMVRGDERWVVETEEGGKRVRKFFTSRADGEKFVAANKEKDGEKQVVLTGSEMHDFLLSKEILNGVKQTVAALFYAQHHHADKTIRMTVALTEAKAAKEQAERSTKYLQTFEARLQSLSDSLADPSVSSVTHTQIAAWLNAQEWAAVTRNRALIDVQTFFKFCLRRGYCMSIPTDAVERVDAGEFEKGILTPDQARALMMFAMEHYRPLVVYLADQLFGGLREEEARRLKPEQIRDTYIEILAAESKTKTLRFVELNPTWKAWREIKSDKAGSKCWASLGAFRVKAKAHLLKLGLVDAEWWFPRNALRHSFSTYAAKAWGSTKAAELAGHSEAIQKKHYKRPVTADEAKAFWSILP